MSKTQLAVWTVVTLIVLGALIWWWAVSQAQPSAQQQSGTDPGAAFVPATSTAQTDTVQASAPMSATVLFDGSTFSPANVTIAQGGTVTWTSTDGTMWVASDPQPLSNGYDGTTMQQHCAPGYDGAAPFDECAGGTTFSFTFDSIGTWGYHDYLQPASTGEVTVVAQQ